MLPLHSIAVVCDGSSASDRIERYARDLARRCGAEVRVLHLEPHPADAEEIGLPVAREPGAAGGGPAPGLVAEEEARSTTALLGRLWKERPDLAVIGTQAHRGVREMLFGGLVEEVVRHAPCPVLTLHTEVDTPLERGRFGPVLAPVDFSPHALRSLRTARELAAFFGASLDVLHVAEPLQPTIVDAGVFTLYQPSPERTTEQEQGLEAFYQEAGGPEVEHRLHVVRGNPALEIGRLARAERCALLVLSTHGRTGLMHYLLGSVAERVIHTVDCPVLTMRVPRPGQEAAEERLRRDAEATLA